MAFNSTVDLSMSGLERDFANRTKSSSTFEDRLSMEVRDGRVTFICGLGGTPSGDSKFCCVSKR